MHYSKYICKEQGYCKEDCWITMITKPIINDLERRVSFLWDEHVNNQNIFDFDRIDLF